MLSRSGSFLVYEGPQRAAGFPSLGSAVDIHGKPLSENTRSLAEHDCNGRRRPSTCGWLSPEKMVMPPNEALLPFQARRKPGSSSGNGSRAQSSGSTRSGASRQGAILGRLGNTELGQFSKPSSSASRGSSRGRNIMTPPAAGMRYNVDYCGSGGKFLGM